MLVLELDGRRALAHLNLGIIYMQQLHDYEASLEHLNLAIRYGTSLSILPFYFKRFGVGARIHLSRRVIYDSTPSSRIAIQV